MTPTPRSTALPDVAPPAPLGSSDRPVALLFVLPPDAEAGRANQAPADLQTYLQNESALAVQVQIAANDSAALQALCSGLPSGEVAAAWASAFTAAAAQQSCGAIPVLALSEGRGARVTIGQTAEIVGRTGINNLTGLAGRTFCRSGELDFLLSWVFPRLLMAGQGVRLADLRAVKDYPDNLTLLEALAKGDCDAAALLPGEMEQRLDELASLLSEDGEEVTLEDLEQTLKVVTPAADVTYNASSWKGYPNGVIPYPILAFPADRVIAAEMRAMLAESIAGFFNDPTLGSARRAALLGGAAGVIPVTLSAERDDLAAFTGLLAKAGWELSYRPDAP